MEKQADAQTDVGRSCPLFLLPHVAARLFDTPLAIEPRKLRTIIAVLSPRFGLTLQGAEVQAVDAQAKKRKPYSVVNGIAVIPVMGTLVQRSLGLDALSGLTSYTQLSAEFAQALNDPEVQQILLHIDSPGGEASGLFDFTDQIFASRDLKPSIALIDGMGTSAAYAIAAAAGQTFVTQGSISGSVGVRLMHVDESQANAADGYVVTEIYAGAHKIDGSSNMPLTDSGLAALQEIVNESYDLFTNKAAQYRGTSQAAMAATEAALYVGAKAIPGGLVDGVATLEHILSGTLPDKPQPTTMPVNPGTMEAEMDKPTTVAELTALYPDLCREIAAETAAHVKAEAVQAKAEAITAEQGRIKEILSLAGYALPKLVDEALFVGGGLSVDKSARLFLEKKYEKTGAAAAAFLADAQDPVAVSPLPVTQVDGVQATVNKQLGLDEATFQKYRNGGTQPNAQ